MKKSIFINFPSCFLFRFPFTNTWFRYKKWWKVRDNETNR